MIKGKKKSSTEVKAINEDLVAFYAEVGMDESDILSQVKNEREIGDNYVSGERDEIEADLVLLRNQVKQKGKIGDTTLFNVHTALVARSFHNKTPIKFKGDKNGADKVVKMLNQVYKEDSETPYMKALNYYGYFDKYATGITIKAKVGWDGTYKRNIFQIINPLLAVPDPAGDYLTGDYRFIGFSSIKTEQQLKDEGYDTELLQQGASSQGAIASKTDSQSDQGLTSLDTSGLYEVYLHFCHIDGRKVWILTGANETTILNAGIVPAGNKMEEKNVESIKFPLSFKYWKPLRDNFFGDRPANYCRDVQIQKAIIANLRLDKMRAELYPMYLYNKDYVSGKDLSFGFNKGIPISTGINGPQVNLQNLVSPVQKDLRIDTSITVEQLMDRQVEKSTSIGDVVQGTTPGKRETLGTNQLIQSNTDVNLSLNEEIDLIGVEKEVIDWFSGYYQNFTDADKKLVFAGMGTGKIPLNLKRKDFIYTGNLAISIESNAMSESRKAKQALAYQVTGPLILQDQSINEGSKRATLRRILEANGIEDEDIDIEVPKTPQQTLQAMENELLNDGEYIDINPDDDDEQHLMEMGSMILTKEAEAHQMAHLQATITKGKQLQEPSQDKGLLNQSQAVANSVASSQQAEQV